MSSSPKPVIAITGTPEWSASIEQQLAPAYRIERYTEHSNYVPRLADAQTAMILVDGDDANWPFWTSTPKVHNATRRIPVIVVTANATVRRAALTAGADIALSPDDMAAQIGTLVADYARVDDPERLAQLDCECQEPLPPLAAAGIEQFNAGAYYPQHDLFEEQWMQTKGPVRDLYRAILQVGIAYYQIERGNHRGALKMLLRSVQWLLMLPDECQGVDVRQLRADAFRVRTELEAMHPEDIHQFDRSLLKPVRLVEG